MNAWKQFLNELGAQPQVFVVGPLLKGIINPTGPTIFVDGGIQFRSVQSQAKVPMVSVGDGDSSQVKLDYVLPKEKDFSDLGFVLRELPLSVRHVELYGFIGARLDHQLANFGEVHHFLKGRKVFTTVRFEEAIVGFSGGPLKIKLDGTFSIMVLDETPVTITGACDYPLEKPTPLKPMSSLGLSNKGYGEVLISAPNPCFLFML